MRFFHVYTHESGRIKLAGDGFSMAAFLFTFFFTAFRGLWLLSVISFCASCASYAAFYYDLTSLPCYLLMEFLIKLYAGFSYSDWVRSKLRKRNYQVASVVLAQNKLHAKLKFMESTQQKHSGADLAHASAQD